VGFPGETEEDFQIGCSTFLDGKLSLIEWPALCIQTWMVLKANDLPTPFSEEVNSNVTNVLCINKPAISAAKLQAKIGLEFQV